MRSPETGTPDHEETNVDLFTAPMGTKHYSANLMADLVVTGRAWHQPGVDDPRGLPADQVALSHDGKAWTDGWHSGPECGEAVYVEKHTRGGAVFHGWVDAQSRRVVQTG